jgi:hypothetical protein
LCDNEQQTGVKRLLRTAEEALSFSSAVFAITVLIEWLQASGFYNYFRLTPYEAGVTNSALFLEGVLYLLPAGGLVAIFVLVERRVRRPFGAVIGILLTAILVAANAVTRQLIVPGTANTASIIVVNSARNALIVALSWVAAVALCRRTRTWTTLTAKCLVAFTVLMLPLSYAYGRFYAEGLLQNGNGGAWASALGPYTRVFNLVRVRGVPEAPESCGLLLGSEGGQYLIWFETRGDGQPEEAARHVLKPLHVPVDSALLLPCEKLGL